MNWTQIEGKWDQLKGSAKSQWGELTDDDLDKAEGDRDKLVGAIKERYGKSKEAVEKEVDAWFDKH